MSTRAKPGRVASNKKKHDNPAHLREYNKGAGHAPDGVLADLLDVERADDERAAGAEAYKRTRTDQRDWVRADQLHCPAQLGKRSG